MRPPAPSRLRGPLRPAARAARRRRAPPQSRARPLQLAPGPSPCPRPSSPRSRPPLFLEVMSSDRPSCLEDDRAGRKDAVESGPRRRRIALSRFCYRRRKTLAPQGPRQLPKLDVAGSTPVAPYSGRKQLGSVDREDCNPISFGAPLTRMTLTSLPPCRSPNLYADLAAAGFIEPVTRH